MKKILFLICAFLASISASAYDFKVDGIYYSIINGSTAEVTRGDTSYSGDIIIPDRVSYNGTSYSVISIGDDAFIYSGLTSVTIPNSITSIGSTAFKKCTCLTSVTIPNSVTSIDYCAFYDCTGLTSVTIGESVETIGQCAFWACISLTSVTIPNSVTSIGGSAFQFCSGLTSVTIPNSVTSIGDCAFYCCTGLTSITIGESVKTIGDDAFYGCTGLTSVTIGESVKTIGKYAFYYCPGLTSVTIGESVETIDRNAFDACEKLSLITSLAPIPPSVNYDSFYKNNYQTATLEVLPEALNAYKEHSVWSKFLIKELSALDDIENPDDDFSFSVDGGSIHVNAPEGTKIEIYNMGGNLVRSTTDQTIDGLSPGIYILRHASKTHKLLIK